MGSKDIDSSEILSDRSIAFYYGGYGLCMVFMCCLHLQCQKKGKISFLNIRRIQYALLSIESGIHCFCSIFSKNSRKIMIDGKAGGYWSVYADAESWYGFFCTWKEEWIIILGFYESKFLLYLNNLLCQIGWLILLVIL